ncbi:type II secretion system F family protein [Halobacillus yeomjeoni]|nr:type II secretion system F family protein [Halobacillus yeomjeoni]
MLLVLSQLMKYSILREKQLPTNLQITFFHRLSHILQKGYPLLDGLKMIGWDESLRYVADELTRHLTKGETIDNAFRKVNFSPLVINFLYFGRIHHDLPAMFQKCEKLLRMRRDYKKKLASVLRYPVFLFLFIFLAFTIIKKTVLPNFILLFNDQHSSLWLLIGLNYFINGLFLLTTLLASLLLLYKLAFPKISTQKRLYLHENVPLQRTYQSYFLSYLFTTHLHSLLTAGLTLKQSLEVMQQNNKYGTLSVYSKKILIELESGKSMSQAIHTCPLFRKELTDLFHQSLDLHSLQDELEMLTDFLMDYVQEKINKWIQWIQPLFFIVIALIVLSIYASIMLPLYQWMSEI